MAGCGAGMAYVTGGDGACINLCAGGGGTLPGGLPIACGINLGAVESISLQQQHRKVPMKQIKPASDQATAATAAEAIIW